MKTAIIASILTLASLPSFADTSVTSNVSTVRAWYREQLTFDDEAGAFSRTDFPSLAEATARHATATNLPSVYDEATASMSNALAETRARISALMDRPVCTLIVCPGPNCALDRQNLTFYVVSNELTRSSGLLHVDYWVFGNSVLRSPPIMEADITTASGTALAGTFIWDDYGTNSVSIVRGGETFECYRMSLDIRTAATNMNVYLNPVVQIARKGQRFNFGNRRMNVNSVETCTTNTLSFLGQFYTTNGVEITGWHPYADNGELFWADNTEENE